MHDIDFGSYVDDETPYNIGNDMEDFIFKIQNSSKVLRKNEKISKKCPRKNDALYVVLMKERIWPLRIT